jgi:DNA-directed RNA polymerase subunit M/transcription elongation factor TFIIS
MDIKIDMKFQCPQCKEIIQHNYKEKDLLNRTHLDLICQNCNYTGKIETSKLIEKAKEEAINEIKRNFKTV